MSEDFYPMALETQMAPKNWGSTENSPFFYNPGLNVGEVWLLTDGPFGSSRVDAGPLAGMSLERLRSLFGKKMFAGSQAENQTAPLPIEIKIFRTEALTDLRVLGSDRFMMVLEQKADDAFWALGPNEPFPAIRNRLTASKTPVFWPEFLVRQEVETGQCLFAPNGTLCQLGPGLTVLEVGLTAPQGQDLLVEGLLSTEEASALWAEELANPQDLAPLTTNKNGIFELFANDFFKIESISATYHSDIPVTNQMVFLLPLFGQGRLMTPSPCPTIRLKNGTVYFLPLSLGRYAIESNSNLTFLKISVRCF